MAADGCTRKVIVHQPEVEWLRQQIPAEYSHEIALSDVAGAELPAQDSAAWTAWSADEWRPVAAEKRSQLSAGRIASMLTDERRMVMNLDVPGAWHYYPVDLLKNMFPLDGSRVLGLAAMPPEGLAFNGTAEDVKEKIFRLLRRLMLIAAVADRLPVAPVFSCQVIQM
eukprot:gene26359-32331_t